MCFFSSGSSKSQPVTLPPLPPIPPSPRSQDPAVSAARGTDRRRAALAQGRGATVLTSGLGLTQPAIGAKKSLLGT